MKQYLDLAERVRRDGEYKPNRTGIGTYSVFGAQLRFKMSDGYPIVTTKSVHFPSVAHELLWFISGNTNTRYLTENGVRIWNEWADENGNLGPVYGEQWRKWKDYKIECYSDIGCGLEPDPVSQGYQWIGNLTNPDISTETSHGLYSRKIDQLQNVIDKLRENPNDRRMIVSAWNPSVLPDDAESFSQNVANGKQALPPCHAFFQFYHINGKLSLHIYQRSVDVFLGLPFNIASYALLLHMVARITGLEPYELVWSGGDVHLYENHLDQIDVQMSRAPMGLPALGLNPDCKEIDDFSFDDIQLINYNHHSKLTGKVAT